MPLRSRSCARHPAGPDARRPAAAGRTSWIARTLPAKSETGKVSSQTSASISWPNVFSSKQSRRKVGQVPAPYRPRIRAIAFEPDVANTRFLQNLVGVLNARKKVGVVPADADPQQPELPV